MPWIALDESAAQTAPIVTTGGPKTNVGATLQTLQADLIRIMANRSDVTGSAALQTKWINQGYRWLCSMVGSLPQLNSSWTIVLTGNQPFYKTPVTPEGFESIAAIKRVGVIDTSNYVQGGVPLDPIDE